VSDCDAGSAANSCNLGRAEALLAKASLPTKPSDVVDHNSNVALSELSQLSSLFGFPDLPAPADQSISTIDFHTSKFTAFAAAVQQQVGAMEMSD